MLEDAVLQGAMQVKNNIKNVVLVDILVDSNWEFADGISDSLGESCDVLSWDNAGLKQNKFFNMKRIFGYFYHSFYVFINRKKFKNIIAWQQFYGIIYALFCELLRVRKINSVIVMTFIFKPKKGLRGKAFKYFVSKAVKSKYIDKFIVYSRSEVELYSALFDVEKDKFQYLELGIPEKKKLEKTEYELPTKFMLSVGRSNRDYEFLFSCIKNIDYKFVVLCDDIDKSIVIPNNVILYNNIRGDEYLKILEESQAVLIALKDPQISSGQLVMLQAMQYKKPIIITESDAIYDYVTNMENAIISPKITESYRNAVYKLINNSELCNTLGENGRRIFESKFSLRALGYNVGLISNSLRKDN